MVEISGVKKFVVWNVLGWKVSFILWVEKFMVEEFIVEKSMVLGVMVEEFMVYPIFEDQNRFLRSFFRKILTLCTVSIQDRFIIKSGLHI